MRGYLETIVGAMFAGKTSELLKRILWAEHQGKKLLVIKPKIDDRYSEALISTHNNLTHNCYPMENWNQIEDKFDITKKNYDILFLDEIQFMNSDETIRNVDSFLDKGVDVVCAGLDQDSRGKPWETSSLLLGLADKITKIYGFCNVCGIEATKTYRKIQGGERTQVGASDIYEPRCLKHWEPR
ncbi:MAG: Thymidine kinase [Alphaproteobacteria bacterium MarineAlpha5_Bin9]|nr:MAG: Thymidine kinase [Alphaproteobacteria bacterium MarineAlpha5_Bin9]|tara:strand:+ start:18962 stop:19513 length:552 start_codon:yes stop_codon:yes gene_type:complete